jgi:putative SOS response-associated peptidase YedK
MIKQRAPVGFDFEIHQRMDIEEYYDQLILPQRLAPVVRKVGDDIELLPMRFSLLPRWSKEPRVKFATHNARLESIDEKATWKDAFQKRHCLVPMSSFIEPIYDGDLAGNMVAFQQPKDILITAAGIWEEWVNKETGEIIPSFSIITSTPPKFIEKTGHDRCPVFLTGKAQNQWLLNENSTPAELKTFLSGRGTDLEFTAQKFRPMKPGWEKRK